MATFLPFMGITNDIAFKIIMQKYKTTTERFNTDSLISTHASPT